MTLRTESLSCFDRAPTDTRVIRGQSFTVHRFDRGQGQAQSLTSNAETLFIFAQASGELRSNGQVLRVPARSMVIAPPGNMEIHPDGNLYALTTGAQDATVDLAINAACYKAPDSRVKPIAPEAVRMAEQAKHMRVYEIDKMPFPSGNARLKFLRTATMSINWVEYEGPRDRSQLSPHSHSDFEQGSLAIAGEFIHHIRTPWTANANQWREDQHIDASADSVLIIPPELVHTTEGIGEGLHILIDIFAPAREDFIAKGWVHNAGDYQPG